MYNELVKEKFMNAISLEADEASLRHYRASLQQCENVEVLLNKDVSDFSYSELIYLFETNHWVSFSTFFSIKSRLLLYIKWKNGGDLPPDAPINRIKHTDIKGVVRFSTDYAKDLNDVKAYVLDNLVYSDADPIWKDCVMIIYCLLFYGFDIDEVGWIRLSDIDRQQNKITLLNGKTTYTNVVDDELIKLIFKVSEEDTVLVARGITEANVPLRKDGYVLRSMDTNEPNYTRRGRTLLRFLTNAKKEIASEIASGNIIQNENVRRSLTPKTVYKSGIFYRAMNSGKEIDYNYFIENERNVGNYIQSKKILEEYKMWKNVFY